MKEGNRKVDEQAREVISSILLFEVSDPRLQLVTITGCSISFDRSEERPCRERVCLSV